MSGSLRIAAVAAATGMALGTSGALADGYYVGSVKDTAPAPAPEVYEWNGLSVGAGIGVGLFDQDASGKAWRKDKNIKKKACEWEWHKYVRKLVWDCDKHSKGDKYTDLHSQSESDKWSVFGTLQIGYDRLLTDRLLIGAFADFDFFHDNELKFSDSSRKGSLNGSVDRENMWTIGGRLGYLVTPRVLVYGLAGYSQLNLDGELDAKFSDPLGGPHSTNANVSINERVDGWTVGGGVEAKLEKRLSLKLEYRYSHFDGAQASYFDMRDGDFKKDYGKGFNYKLYDYERTIKEGAKLDLDDTDVHSIRAVLSFKLGGHEESVAPLK